MERTDTWRREVAGRVAELIVEANGGSWPVSIWHWRRVARRFGLTLSFIRAAGPFTACIIEDLLIVRWTYGRPAPVPWVSHEICEAALVWDGEPEYRYCSRESPERERHRVACLVERIAMNRISAL